MRSSYHIDQMPCAEACAAILQFLLLRPVDCHRGVNFPVGARATRVAVVAIVFTRVFHTCLAEMGLQKKHGSQKLSVSCSLPTFLNQTHIIFHCVNLL